MEKCSVHVMLKFQQFAKFYNILIFVHFLMISYVLQPELHIRLLLILKIILRGPGN